MSVARQQEAPDPMSYETQEYRRRGTSGSMVLSSLVMLALLGGLGYFAFELYKERGQLRTQLAASQREATALRTEVQSSTELIARTKEAREQEGALFSQTKQALEELEREHAATKTRLDELNEERGAIEEQLAEFKQMTDQLRRMIDSGRLEVVFRKGRMIVQLPAQVLFPSGSADLTDGGREALAEVAKSLRGLKNRRFIVAGHTDNVPVSGRFASNWELSSARAVNVTDALIKGGLRPEQLVAAGYSEYDPVARNTTEKNKQKNRRIEIILEPRLRPLPELKTADARK